MWRMASSDNLLSNWKSDLLILSVLNYLTFRNGTSPIREARSILYVNNLSTHLFTFAKVTWTNHEIVNARFCVVKSMYVVNPAQNPLEACENDRGKKLAQPGNLLQPSPRLAFRAYYRHCWAQALRPSFCSNSSAIKVWKRIVSWFQAVPQHSDRGARLDGLLGRVR